MGQSRVRAGPSAGAGPVGRGALTCSVAHSSDCRSLNWILSEVLWMWD